VEDSFRREWIQGLVDCHYVIGRSESGLKILAEDGHVVEKRKGALAFASPQVQRAQPVDQQQPIRSINGSQVPAANQRVYTAPELQNVIGHRLNGAWLRGDFIVVQRSGNRAILQSFADMSRYRLEISQNGKPVVFPRTTLVNLTLSHEDGTLIRGNTVTVSEASPLRLISVSKDAEGYTIVEAEF
jgi:hypothetical protein